MKQTLKIGITMLVVAALAMSGVALAQTAGDEAPAVEDTKAYGAIQAKLAPLVADTTITQAQADSIAATLADGMRGPRPDRGRGFQAIGQVADFLELTPEEMRAAVSEYDTLAEIAAANGSSGDELVAYLVAQLGEHLDEAVANGRLTAEDAEDRLAEAEEHLTDVVNGDLPQPGDRPFRGRRGPAGDRPFAGSDA